MQAFSFLHCADIHLGTPFQGLADLPPELSERLREAPTRAFDRAIATALERRVAAVIIAGDLFDAADRNLRAQIQARDRLQRLHEAGIPTLIAAGNHDPLGTAAASIRYPSSVHFFQPEVESAPLTREGAVLAHVYGISYGAPDVRDNLASQFPERPEGPFAIGVLHTNVGDRAGHASYAPCSLRDLESRAFDYWALGHVHQRETLRAERPVVHYPGNTQGLHMREVGPRGATLVEVAASGAIKLTPVWTDTVRWHRVRTPIDDLASLDDLISAYAEVAAAAAGEAPDRLHIILWTLGGRGPLHDDLRRHGVVPDLVEAFRNEHAAEAVPGAVWLQRIDVATRARRDFAELRKQQELLGDLLRLADEARSNPPPHRNPEVGSEVSLTEPNAVSVAIQERLAELLDDPRLAAALGIDPWEVLDWPHLIARAESLAVDGLLADDPGER